MKRILSLIVIGLCVWLASFIIKMENEIARQISGFVLALPLSIVAIQLVKSAVRSKGFLDFFGIKKNKEPKLISPHIDFKIQAERELSKAVTEAMYSNELNAANTKIKRLEAKIYGLENPPKPSKFKVGDVFGKFAISQINGTSECSPHYCITKEGEVFRYSESQIEAMMKLNSEPQNTDIITIVKDKELSDNQKTGLLRALFQLTASDIEQILKK